MLTKIEVALSVVMGNHVRQRALMRLQLAISKAPVFFPSTTTTSHANYAVLPSKLEGEG